MNLSNKQYDFVKRLVTIILPAVSSLYFGLAQIWGLPAAEQVVGTIALITVFLGTVLGLSNNTFSGDGTVRVGFDDDGFYELKDLDLSQIRASEIAGKKKVVLRVENQAAA